MMQCDHCQKELSPIVQIYNPRSCRWMKLDRRLGKIIHMKKYYGPYKNIPILEVNYYEKAEIREIQSAPKVGSISRSEAKIAAKKVSKK